jgi:hypothetical protein
VVKNKERKTKKIKDSWKNRKNGDILKIRQKSAMK